MATIKKLSQEVINRIAAGEVIQRPLSAIKELIENCLDANSSMISIMCIDGGFSSIEISDDGKGIDKIDFPLLCERFATSKIEDFTDLMTINSFGFRGEALSSISFVSHLTIKSKTEENSLGFQASFRDGKMLEESIDSIPLNKGTIISVENLFYNLGIRKTSFSFKEEFKEVLKMIYKFAIHHCFVKFKLYSSLKNIEFSSCNLLSKGTDARLELISNIFKINEKKLVSIEQNLQTYSVKIESIISEVGSIKKNRDLFIFINDRLVECDQIKKTIDLIYKSFWVSIHEDEGGYFCYISLKMRSENIDVNVDPRKKLVKFLFAFEICEQITQIYESKLKEKCSIRVYQTVSLPRNSLDIERSMEKNKTNDKIIKNEKAPNKSYVRVDPKSQKLTSFMNINQKSHQNIINNNKEINELPNEVNSLMSSYNNLVKNPQKDDEIIFKLLSIKKESSHEISTLFFHNLTYVGCLNSNFIIAQKDQSLLLINSIPIWYTKIILAEINFLFKV